MEERENRRVALTKRYVRESLLAILRDKSLHKVSIRELCERAGINRSTFYNHYGSQYDVLDEMARDYLVSIERTIAAADMRDRQSVVQRVTLVLRYMRDNLALSRMLINNQLDGTFSERLFSLPKVGEMLEEALRDVESETERRAVVLFAIHGSYRLLQEWINAEEQTAAREEAELILALAGRVCHWR